MKKTLAISLCSAALALTGFGQTPTVPPNPAPPGTPLSTPVATPPPATLATPAAAVPPATFATPAVVPPSPAVAVSPREKDDLESRIERKVRKGVHITFGDDEDADAADRDVTRHDRKRTHVHDSDVEDSALMAIPIVGIIFTTLFGAPVLIVGVIMFFSFWKARSLHRTVRLMVEKGQPVPEALFATPSSPVKMRSDMRRGVVLVMVGIGLMVFFGACNDWEGGAWSLGIIPFLIGCGYLLVWKLEGQKMGWHKTGTDNPPPLP